MSPPLAVVAAADAFWAESGMAPSFPRDLRRAVARSQPVSVVMLAALHVAKAEAWLRRQGKAIDIDVIDRPLRACLVAQSGAGIIFIDGRDGEAEQRYSLAHELAHFLLDYCAPRRAAVARLGEGVLDVLDGHRPARTEERVVGILANVDIRPHVHLMGRFADLTMSGNVAHAESRADTLALELLAPWDDVTSRIAALGISADQAAISRLLLEHYGLPGPLAEQYAAGFCPTPLEGTDLLHHLRVALAPPPRNIE